MGRAGARRGGRRFLRAEANPRPQAELRVGEPELTGEIFHIADRAAWAAAAAVGEYRLSTRGVTLEQEGFIHCSGRQQLRTVVELCYAGVDDLVVLVIDAARVPSPIRYEAPKPGAEEYPHIYGPLPVTAVTTVIPVTRDSAGKLILPEPPVRPSGK